MTRRNATRWTTDSKQPELPIDKPYVLVVEDDPDTCANLSDILEIDGYRVATAGSIQESLAREDWSEISIVILDRRLPDGDARDLLPRIKQLAPDSAVIVVTGNADLDSAVSAIRQGAADYILKPINAESLRASLARLAEKQRIERTLRQSQAQLQQEREFVESLLETVPMFVLLLDADGKIVRFNSYLQDLNGYDVETVLGRDFIQVLFPDHELPRIQGVYQKLLEEGQVAGIISPIRGQDGREVEVRWSAKLLRNSSGATVGVIASGQDITELKQAQERALQNERLAAIGETMAGLVHESRNALQRTRACLEMLADEVADRPAALDFVERAQLAQNDLQQLFEEVREYAAPIKLDRHDSDLATIWRQAWHELGHLHKEKGLELIESMEGVNPHCQVDRFALGQVFRNILENAIQASPNGGQISIACHIPADSQQQVRIAVRDHGPGIPEELRHRVLAAFFTTKTKGTGLGLAIARRIVQYHGGEITVGDNDGLGATIFIHLPRTSL